MPGFCLFAHARVSNYHAIAQDTGYMHFPFSPISTPAATCRRLTRCRLPVSNGQHGAGNISRHVAAAH